ncbi:hypothetical protein Pla52o_28030 [Novipirellula galeiformis]|uniref:Uncharacterized protein n=1 Tax=Novipirellula galeiformis TaxID=2528004 RepID=A0A5C6CHT6_9BACT|nr:hypothetical protein Pla52o_28030 [Novipirellula galeiformis]
MFERKETTVMYEVVHFLSTGHRLKCHTRVLLSHNQVAEHGLASLGLVSLATIDDAGDARHGSCDGNGKRKIIHRID